MIQEIVEMSVEKEELKYMAPRYSKRKSQKPGPLVGRLWYLVKS